MLHLLRQFWGNVKTDVKVTETELSLHTVLGLSPQDGWDSSHFQQETKNSMHSVEFKAQLNLTSKNRVTYSLQGSCILPNIQYTAITMYNILINCLLNAKLLSNCTQSCSNALQRLNANVVVIIITPCGLMNWSSCGWHIYLAWSKLSGWRTSLDVLQYARPPASPHKTFSSELFFHLSHAEYLKSLHTFLAAGHLLPFSSLHCAICSLFNVEKKL